MCLCVCECVWEPDKSNLLSAKQAHFEALQLHKGIEVIRAGRASPKSQARCQLPTSFEICVASASLLLSLSLSFSLYLSVCLFGLSVFVCVFFGSIFTIMAAHQSALKCNAVFRAQDTMRANFGPARCHLLRATCQLPAAKLPGSVISS